VRLKIYADPAHYHPRHRQQLTALMRAHWNDLPPEERSKTYGSRYNLFEVVGDVSEADICVLPMVWQYYVNNHRLEQAYDLARQAADAGKVIVVWVTGDLYTTVPLKNAVIFQNSMYRSRRGQCHYASPAFFPDYLPEYFDGRWTYRRKGERPVVGFCGQAGTSLCYWAKWTVGYVNQWIRFHIGNSPYEPPPLYPPARLRARILGLLEASPRVADNFIIRQHYWAGVHRASNVEAARRQAQLEFVNNIYNSDYTVCVRGTGNYSKRFYETLCLGRIPIFVDTDCVLPYDFAVDWRDYCVWVDHSEIPYIAEKVADFHAGITDDDFIGMQQACRALWKERLSFDGFYRHLCEHLQSDSVEMPSGGPEYVTVRRARTI